MFSYELIQEAFPGATDLYMKLGSALSAPWPYCLLFLVPLISPSLHRVSAQMANFLSAPRPDWVALAGISGVWKSLPLGGVGQIPVLL